MYTRSSSLSDIMLFFDVASHKSESPLPTLLGDSLDFQINSNMILGVYIYSRSFQISTTLSLIPKLGVDFVIGSLISKR
jgi:hypothetical protein